MTKYIVEWIDKNNKHQRHYLLNTFETFDREQAFAKAWELKNDDGIAKVNIKEIITYCFKND